MLSSSHVRVFYSKRRWRTNSSLVHGSWRFWHQKRLIVCFYPQKFWALISSLAPSSVLVLLRGKLPPVNGWRVDYTRTFRHTSILLQLSCSILRSVLHSILLSVLHSVLLSILLSVLLFVLHLQFMIRYCYSACTLQLAPYYTHTTTAVQERFIDAYCKCHSFVAFGIVTSGNKYLMFQLCTTTFVC